VYGKGATSIMSARRASSARGGGAGKGNGATGVGAARVAEEGQGRAGKEVTTKRTDGRCGVHGATRCGERRWLWWVVVVG
jgi:hypothetical protein